ncbi:MAG: cation transporter [Bacilli bacterium]
MEYTYILKGLDCAVCAQNLEHKISKIKGVNDVCVNYMTSKLILDCNEEIIETVLNLCSNFEEGITYKRIR